MRNQEEIQNQIQQLRELKPKVRKSSAFGDNHHDAIEAQIAVLSKRMSSDEVFDTFDPTDDDDINFDEGRADNVLDAAREAVDWLNEEQDEEPSAGWVSLIVK